MLPSSPQACWDDVDPNQTSPKHILKGFKVVSFGSPVCSPAPSCFIGMAEGPWAEAGRREMTPHTQYIYIYIAIEAENAFNIWNMIFAIRECTIVIPKWRGKKNQKKYYFFNHFRIFSLPYDYENTWDLHKFFLTMHLFCLKNTGGGWRCSHQLSFLLWVPQGWP